MSAKRRRHRLPGLAVGIAVLAASLTIAAPAAAAPTITVTPASAAPGQRVHIHGEGFGGFAFEVHCSIQSSITPGAGLLGGAFASGTGVIDFDVEIPYADNYGNRLPPGNYQLSCVASGAKGEVPFTLKPLPSDLEKAPPLANDDQSTGVAINSVGQAAIESQNSSTGADHGAIFSGGQTKAIPGNPIFPTGINDSADVSGSKRFPDFHFQPFVCSFNGTGCAGGVTVFPTPLGGTNGFAAGISNSNVLAGTSDTSGDAASDAFVCQIQGGQCTNPQDLGTLGGDSSNTTAIAGNLVVGFSQTTGNTAMHATDCPISAGTCSLDDLGTLNGGQYSEALGADAAGDIVGDSNFQTPSNPAHHAFICTLANGTCPFKNLGSLPGQSFSFAHAVARWGSSPVVVGDSGPNAFIWGGNRMFQIDKFLSAGSPTITDVNGINSAGQIIGTTGTGRAAIIEPKGLIGSVAYTAGGTLILRPQHFGTPSASTAATPVTVQQGGTVQWTNRDTVAHNVTDASGMGLFHSPSLAPGRAYGFSFPSAGSFPFKDTLHDLSGTVAVPMTDAPAAGNTHTLFQLYWAAGSPPSGYAYDVQVKRPGASSYSPLLTGVKKGLASFTPNAGAGAYYFQARLRNTANGHASGWSSPMKISVSP